jgi:lysophospholipase L1-like esterase
MPYKLAMDRIGLHGGWADGVGIAHMQGGGASTPAAPLRAVSAFNTLGTHVSANGTNTVAKRDIMFKSLHVIGGANVSKIVLSLNNWAIGQNNTDGIRTPACGYRMKELWLSTEAGVSVQVTVGGQGTFVIAAGDNDIHADEILPAAFGLSVFAKNLRFALGGRFIPVDASNVPVDTGNVASMQAPRGGFASFNSVPTAIDVEDTFPVAQLKSFAGFTGTATWAVGGCAPPIIMLGEFADGAEPPVYMGVGDSITYGGENALTQRSGGFFGRAMINDFTTPTVYRAGIKASRDGGIAELWADASANGAQARMVYWSKYANVMIERYGVNARSYPSQYNAKKVIWSKFKTAPDRGGNKTPKVLVMALNGQTTSSDSWATTANQTLGSETNPTGALANINNACLADVGDEIEYYLDTLSIRGNSDKTQNDYWKWATGPTTNDGLHPNATGYEAMAAELRTQLTTIESGW